MASAGTGVTAGAGARVEAGAGTRIKAGAGVEVGAAGGVKAGAVVGIETEAGAGAWPKSTLRAAVGSGLTPASSIFTPNSCLLASALLGLTFRKCAEASCV